MKTPFELLCSAAFAQIGRSRRYVNPGAAYSIIKSQLEKWRDETNEDLSKLSVYFETKRNGKFELAFIHKTFKTAK